MDSTKRGARTLYADSNPSDRGATEVDHGEPYYTVIPGPLPVPSHPFVSGSRTALSGTHPTEAVVDSPNNNRQSASSIPRRWPCPHPPATSRCLVTRRLAPTSASTHHAVNALSSCVCSRKRPGLFPMAERFGLPQRPCVRGSAATDVVAWLHSETRLGDDAAYTSSPVSRSNVSANSSGMFPRGLWTASSRSQRL
jgi:hypothetical protein